MFKKKSTLITFSVIKRDLFRKKRNRTFDNIALLSLQLNPSYQQMGPSLYILYITIVPFRTKITYNTYIYYYKFYIVYV